MAFAGTFSQITTYLKTISSVQFSRSVVSDSLRPHGLQQPGFPITTSQSLLKLMSIGSAMPSNHLILSHPLLLLPSIFPSIRVFSSESVLHIRWLKYWSFSFSISPSNEYSGLISFRIDSQESSPMPQFKSINSLVLSFLYSPTLISIYDYWKNHSLDGGEGNDTPLQYSCLENPRTEESGKLQSMGSLRVGYD